MLGFLRSLEFVLAGILLISGFMLGVYMIELMKTWLSEESETLDIGRKQMALSLAAFSICALSAVFLIKTVGECNKLKSEMDSKMQYGAIKFAKTGEPIKFSDGIITAELDQETGTLTFSGEGAIDKTSEWLRLERPNQVKMIVFADGITRVTTDVCAVWDNFPNLETIVFNGDISVIGNSVFYGCDSLKTVEFNGKCGMVGQGAFEFCRALKEVTFRDGFEVIDGCAFAYCQLLEKVVAEGERGTVNNMAFFFDDKLPEDIFE